jgi:hypothetical protein
MSNIIARLIHQNRKEKEKTHAVEFYDDLTF